MSNGVGIVAALSGRAPRISGPRPPDPDSGLPRLPRAVEGKDGGRRPSLRAAGGQPLRPRGDSAAPAAPRPTRAPPVGGSSRPEGELAKPVLPKDVVRQATEALLAAPVRDGTRVRLSLSPAHLGDLWIDLSVSGSRLRCRVWTQTPAARDLILAHLDDLRGELERRGIRCGPIEVGVDGAGSPEEEPPEGSGRPRSPRRQVLDLRA